MACAKDKVSFVVVVYGANQLNGGGGVEKVE